MNMNYKAYDNTALSPFIYETPPLKQWRAIGRRIAIEHLRDPSNSLFSTIEKYTEGWTSSEKERFIAWLRATIETRYGSETMNKTSQIEKLIGTPEAGEIKGDLYKRLSLFRQKISKLIADNLIDGLKFNQINEILNKLESEIATLSIRAVLEARVKKTYGQLKRLNVEAQELDLNQPSRPVDGTLDDAVELLLEIIGFLETHRVERQLSEVAAILGTNSVRTQDLWDKIGEFAKSSKSITNVLQELIGEISQARGRELLKRREVA